MSMKLEELTKDQLKDLDVVKDMIQEALDSAKGECEAQLTKLREELEKKDSEKAPETKDGEVADAEALEATNRAKLPKRKDAIARAEKELAQAKVAKTEAEAEAIRKDAETRRIQAMAEAKARLMEAVAKLRQEGGDIYVDKDNLNRIIQMDLPPTQEEDNDT